MSEYVLAIDQGTTSTRAILFDQALRPVATVQQEIAQHFPQSGRVEHEPEEIWSSVVSTVRAALRNAGTTAEKVIAAGITNQRETVILWDRRSGNPLGRAIVWQDRRTAELCRGLKKNGGEAVIRQKTGLLADPYFSATKAAWMLDHNDGAREAAKAGHIAFGTIDSFLLWRLTGGKSHMTDATNASRTLLYDILENCWSDDLCNLIRVPKSILPEVADCAAEFGTMDPALFGAAIPVTGIAGDQQAATIGQACFDEGMVKATYGTGCFALMNTGGIPVRSDNQLLTTIGYRLAGQNTYALEGSIFIAGAAVQWLRDGLHMIEKSSDAEVRATEADPAQRVYLVPAFTGLGAPWWDPDARGAMFGLTRNTGPAEFARAALEAACYQTRDLMEAMRADFSSNETPMLRVDGGMTASDWTMQRLADILNSRVDRPKTLESTARGAAYLAGLQRGFYPPPKEFAANWALDRAFEPRLGAEERERDYAGWKDAVRRTLSDNSGG